MADHLKPEPLETYDEAESAAKFSKPAAAAILLREAKVAVALMQERGTGMNETGLAAAILGCEASGILPATFVTGVTSESIAESLKAFGKTKS